MVCTAIDSAGNIGTCTFDVLVTGKLLDFPWRDRDGISAVLSFQNCASITFSLLVSVLSHSIFTSFDSELRVYLITLRLM